MAHLRHTPLKRPRDAPFVGCFKSQDRCYVYDVNTNEILRIDQELFEQVVDAVNGRAAAGVAPLNDGITILRTQGYLSSRHPKSIKTPCDRCFQSALDSKIQQCVLELTQACNHSCKYCAYSGADPRRRLHSQKRMDWQTAKAGIDLLLARSSRVDEPSLGFYGGEPLLEWGLLKRCLAYADEHSVEKPLHKTITTNATLVSAEIAAVLARHNVAVLVSLDGPEGTHNRFRRMGSDGSMGFRATLHGITKLREAYGRKSQHRIMLNAVAGPWTDYVALVQFFDRSPPRAIEGLHYRVSTANLPTDLSLDGMCSTSETMHSRETEKELKGDWRRYTKQASDGKSAPNPVLRHLFERPLRSIHQRPREQVPEALGPMGMCIPGVRKVYIDTSGRILPCERVPESLVIGDVNEGGPRMDACKELLRLITGHFQNRCEECVFCRLCSGCPASYSDERGGITEDSINRHCVRQRRTWTKWLIEYVDCLEDNPESLSYLEGAAG